jgi:hypothetical protein
MKNEYQSGTKENELVTSRGDQVREMRGNDEIVNGNFMLVARINGQVVMQDEGGLQEDALLGEGREFLENTLANME